MTEHAFLPKTLTSDKGSALVSHVIKEMPDAIEITPQHATTKHPQTIGMLERSHASLKQARKNERGERRSMWQKKLVLQFKLQHLLPCKS